MLEATTAQRMARLTSNLLLRKLTNAKLIILGITCRFMRRHAQARVDEMSIESAKSTLIEPDDKRESRYLPRKLTTWGGLNPGTATTNGTQKPLQCTVGTASSHCNASVLSLAGRGRGCCAALMAARQVPRGFAVWFLVTPGGGPPAGCRLWIPLSSRRPARLRLRSTPPPLRGITTRPLPFAVSIHILGGRRY